MKFTYEHRPDERFTHRFAISITSVQSSDPVRVRSFLEAAAEVESWCKDQYPRPPGVGRDFWQARTGVRRGRGREFVVKLLRDQDAFAFRMRWT